MEPCLSSFKNKRRVIFVSQLKGQKNQIISDHYPYEKRLKREIYESSMYKLQIELAKFQNWLRSSKERVVVVF